MMIELQCSNCGTRLSLNPTDFWKYGWRYTGVPYCPHCVKTWKERNGKEWNEEYNEEEMKDKFYEYLFNKIEMNKTENNRYVIYENKETLGKYLSEIKDKVVDIKESLDGDYQDLAETFIFKLVEENLDNCELVSKTIDELSEVIDDLENLTDEIETLEVY